MTALAWRFWGASNKVEITAAPCPLADAGIASELLEAALLRLAGLGVQSVHLTLIASQPQTPALLQVPQRRRSLTAGTVATDLQMHLAGHRTLVAFNLRERVEARPDELGQT